MNEKISVLISSYNKNDLVAIHVRECMNSTRIPDEIIVVNDGGTPDLRDKLSALNKKTKILYAEILPPKIPWNYTGARNLGIWLSKGDFISMEDDDHIPHKDFYTECLKTFEEHPEFGRIKSNKRWVVQIEDVLNKPVEEWKITGSRIPHRDVAMYRREVLLKIKGYDERFAGEYGWCCTDICRRLIRSNIIEGNAGYQYVVFSEKTRGLSYRNFKLSKIQQGTQSLSGILNFTYKYEYLS